MLFGLHSVKKKTSPLKTQASLGRSYRAMLDPQSGLVPVSGSRSLAVGYRGVGCSPTVCAQAPAPVGTGGTTGWRSGCLSVSWDLPE